MHSRSCGVELYQKVRVPNVCAACGHKELIRWLVGWLVACFTIAAISTYLLPRLIGYSRAVGLLLSGGTYSPDSPLLQGLYHATFPNREDVLPAALAFARELAANTSQTGVAWTKALLWRGADSIEGQHILDSRGIADLASRGDAAEGAQAFKEHRAVRFSDVLSRDLSDFVPWVSHSCG